MSFTTLTLRERFNWAASTRQATLTLVGAYSDLDLSDTQNKFLEKFSRVIEESDNLPGITL